MIVRFLKKNWLLILIIVLAVILRGYRIADYMEFLGDQGRDVVIVSRFLKQGDLMAIGPQTSVGNMYLGPWYYYLMAPSLLLAGFNPVGPAIMVMLLGVATVWLVWKVASEWFDQGVGLVAALLTAVSPVLIYYSIFSWNPNIMPFFALLSIWCTWRVWQSGEYRKMPLLAFSLAMALNSHYLGFLLLPPAGLFCLLALRRNKKTVSQKEFWAWVGFSLVVFLVLMSPLVFFDLKHQFGNFNAFKKFFVVRQETVNIKWYKGLIVLPTIVGQVFNNILARKDLLVSPLLFLLAFLTVLIKNRKNRALWFIVFWFGFGVLGLANYKQHVYAHYFGFLYPLSLMILALFFRSWRRLTLPLFFLTLVLMVANWHGFRSPNSQLTRTREIAQLISDRSNGEDFALALVAEQNYDPPYRYFLELKNAPLVDLHKKIPEQLFVVCEPWGKVNCNPIGHPQWEIAAFGWAKIDQEWEWKGIKILKLTHEKVN